MRIPAGLVRRSSKGIERSRHARGRSEPGIRKATTLRHGVVMPALMLATVAAMTPLTTHAQSRPGPFRSDSDEFPIGMYDVGSNDTDFATLKAAGFNYVHRYWMGYSAEPEVVQECQQYLNLAQKHELKVMVNLYGHKWAKEVDGVETMRTFVRGVKDRPALGLWLLIDEPGIGNKGTAETLTPFYKMLKTEAPDVPVGMVFGWSDSWHKYGSVHDVAQIDYYSVRKEPFPKSPLVSTARLNGKLIGRGKPAMPVLQAFSYAVWTKDPEKAKQFRAPNLTEFRYLVFSSLAQGARGLFFFSHRRCLETGEDFFEQVVARIVRDELVPFIKRTRPAHKPTILHDQSDTQTVWFGGSKAPEAYVARWTRPTGDYLVLVSNNNVKTTIEHEVDTGTKTLLPWGLTRHAEVTIDGGRIQIEAQPLEVFIWRLTDGN